MMEQQIPKQVNDYIHNLVENTKRKYKIPILYIVDRETKLLI